MAYEPATGPPAVAEALLRERLDPAQLADRRATGGFNLQAADGSWWRIHGHKTCYHAVDDQGVGYCAAPKGVVPVGDRDLATMLMLQDERSLQQFKDTSNLTYDSAGAPAGVVGDRRLDQEGCTCAACTLAAEQYQRLMRMMDRTEGRTVHAVRRQLGPRGFQAVADLLA